MQAPCTHTAHQIPGVYFARLVATASMCSRASAAGMLAALRPRARVRGAVLTSRSSCLQLTPATTAEGPPRPERTVVRTCVMRGSAVWIAPSSPDLCGLETTEAYTIAERLQSHAWLLAYASNPWRP
eukprot:364180-Chlamydomonas_euryale.AAC.6